MKVYFFSRHEAQTEMINDLGGIDQQFPGNIANISRKGDRIEFTETVNSETQTHSIEANSIIVAVAPLPLQCEWLTALKEEGLFLIPGNNRIINEDGVVEFHYAGLTHIKKILIEKELWAGRVISPEEKANERASLI